MNGLTVLLFCNVHIDIGVTLNLLRCLRDICGCWAIQCEGIKLLACIIMQRLCSYWHNINSSGLPPVFFECTSTTISFSNRPFAVGGATHMAAMLVHKWIAMVICAVVGCANRSVRDKTTRSFDHYPASSLIKETKCRSYRLSLEKDTRILFVLIILLVALLSI